MKIAIKANPSRGKEIISLLKSLGGINEKDWKGDGDLYVYYIDKNNEIQYEFLPKDYKLYTLEEFETQFPFKVGDEVTIIGLPDYPKVITKMTWMDNEVFYTFGDNTWYNTEALRKLEMKEERNITLTLDKAKEWYKKGGELKEIALQAFTEKELTKVDLPKTWEEFCGNYPIKEGESYAGDSSEIYTHCKSNGERDSELDRNMCPTPKSAEAHLALIQLEQLRDCWRQGWVQTPTNTGYRINKMLTCDYVVMYVGSCKYFLSFPTREMAEEFLECFRDLIEKAGDLI